MEMTLFYLLLFIWGAAKAFADLSEEGSLSLPYKFHKDKSWRNKYKEGDPVKGPKFFLSTTLFVFVTDFWHFMNFIGFTSVCIAFILYNPYIWWADLLSIIGMRFLGFNFTYELFKEKIFRL